MRIAMLTPAFPTVSETFIIHQIRALLALGHRVDIYSEFRPPAHVPMHAASLHDTLISRTTYVAPPSPHRVEWIPASVVALASDLATAPALALTLLNPWRYGRYALNLSGLHRLRALRGLNRNYDVIHAHFGPIGDRYRFARQLWHAPLVVTFHGFDYCVWPREHGQHCYDRLFATADAVTVNSDNTAQRVAALSCSPGKISKVPAAWDIEGFPLAEHRLGPGEPVRILTVARLVEIKGVEYAIRAMATVRDRMNDRTVRYDIIGEGPLRPKLEALVAELHLDTCVTLHGAAPIEDVRAFMAAAHVFVHASVTTPEGDEEGQGVVLVEAQAAGLPVVATRHGPFAEVVAADVSGFLVPERDPVALAGRIVMLIQQPELRRQMGLAGRRHVEEHFHPRDITNRLVEVYARSIANYVP